MSLFVAIYFITKKVTSIRKLKVAIKAEAKESLEKRSGRFIFDDIKRIHINSTSCYETYICSHSCVLCLKDGRKIVADFRASDLYLILAKINDNQIHLLLDPVLLDPKMKQIFERQCQTTFIAEPLSPEKERSYIKNHIKNKASEKFPEIVSIVSDQNEAENKLNEILNSKLAEQISIPINKEFRKFLKKL